MTAIGATPLLLAGVTNARAQCDGWRTGPALTNAGVVSTSLSWDPDGNLPQPAKLVIAGGFAYVGWPAIVPAQNIATWDGTSWQALGSGVLSSDPQLTPITAMATSGTSLVVGGNFTSAGGVAAANIARWDGTSWHALGSGLTGSLGTSVPPGKVFAMTNFNGDLIVSGDFTTAGGVLCNGLARWNGTAWSAFGDGPGTESFVNALAVYNGQLYAGGFFSFIDGIAAGSIARWTGATWTPVGPGIPDGLARAMIVYNNELVVLGQFDHVGGVAANNIAAWNGSTWHALGAGITMSDTSYWGPTTLAVYNGSLIVGGYFDQAGPWHAQNVARWDGSNWNLMDELGLLSSNYSLANVVYTLTAWGGKLYAGGEFYRAYSVDGTSYPVCGLSAWNGTVWEKTPGVITDYGSVNALTVFNNRVVAGGLFNFIDSNTSYINRNLASWNGVGVVGWTGLNAGANGPVNALKTYTTGSGPAAVQNLVLAGEFTTAGELNAHLPNATRVALHSEGSLGMAPAWSTMGTGFNLSVYALERMNGFTYAGGAFTASGDNAVPLSRIARFDGTNWVGVGPGPTLGVNGTVHALKFFNVTTSILDLVVGGEFTTAGGAAATRMAIYGINTLSGSQSWSAMGSGLNNTVLAIERFNSSTYAGGDFTNRGDNTFTLNHVARFDGTTWQPVGSGFNGTVRALLTEGGYLYAAGDFTASGATTLNHVARWDGTSWSDVRGGANGTVNALAAFHNEVHAGGSFTIVQSGAVPSPQWARYLETGAPWIAAQPLSISRLCRGGTAAFFVQVAEGYSGMTYTWRKNGTPISMGPTGTGSIYADGTSTLIIYNVSRSDQGTFDCVISSPCGGGGGETSIAVTLSVCLADFNCDGIVNVADIFAFLAAWFSQTGHTGFGNSADANVDGVVNVSDIFVFLAAWFAGC